jgi:hypothetical protein
MANPAGFIHLSCAPEYFETTDIIDRLHHFGVDLSKDDQSEIERFLT